MARCRADGAAGTVAASGLTVFDRGTGFGLAARDVPARPDVD